MTKLWITSNHFVEVDDEGFYRGPLGEGVLGSVLMLQHGTEKERFIAWKLPRLLADTPEENSYIEGLLSQELKVVMSIWGSAGDRGQTLLRCRDEKDHGAFKGLRTLEGAPGEAAAQHGYALFVQFQKTSPPRLCLAKFDDSGLHVIPNGAKPDLEPLMNKDAWRILRAGVPLMPPGVSSAQGEPGEKGFENKFPPFEMPAFCALPQHTQVVAAENRTIAVDTLEGAIRHQVPLKAWYTGLSAIQWDWAPKNLQQAIADGNLQGWEPEDHLVLWDRCLEAISALHENSYLHSDLRPANIFSRGDGKRPSGYYVGDYGSFASGEGGASVGPGTGGNTLLGAEVGRGRASPFYSFERRAGVERESADTAIIIYEPVAKQYRIWLGWKTQVLDKDGKLDGTVTSEILNAKPFALAPAAPDSSEGASHATSDYLKSGDRIRLRDEVFKVVSVGPVLTGVKLAGGLLCFCEGTSATVVHNRLTVREDKAPAKGVHGIARIVPLSSFTELRQWSAATDLFSIGALFIYTLYSSGRQKNYLPNTVAIDRSQQLSPVTGAQSLVVIDSEFRQLMEVLESVPYLTVLWRDLDHVWATVVGAVDKIGEIHDTALIAQAYGNLFDELTRDRHDSEKNRELSNVVSNITQSVPNIKVILQQFNWRMIPFVLFMHFVLRCLHRKDHLGSGVYASYPFCSSRSEAPARKAAAQQAYEVLESLKKLLSNPQFGDSRVVGNGSALPDYDVRSEYSVIRDNALLIEKVKSLNGLIAGIKGNRGKLNPSTWGSETNARQVLYAAIDAAQIASLDDLVGKRHAK